MIQISMGKLRLVDAEQDPLGRSQVGWAKGLTDQQLFENARGTWVVSEAKAKRERYAVVVGEGAVRLIFEIDNVVPAEQGRRAFEGKILGAGHPVYDAYMGKSAPNGAQQNPITYFDSPLDNRTCRCGCGESINRGDFLPGHDQRAIHAAIARIGTVAEFLDWFEEKANEEQ